MAKICVNCNEKIGFGNATYYNEKLMCFKCASELQKQKEEQRNEIINEKRKTLINEFKKEISLKDKSLSNIDDNFKRKLEEIKILVDKGILTYNEFNSIKETLFKQYDKHSSKGRFITLWEFTKEKACENLVAPASAKFPNLKEEFIDFTDCNENEFIFDAYCDSQARSSAMLRLKFRVKFDLRDDSFVGISWYQDLHPPWQKMGWTPYLK